MFRLKAVSLQESEDRLPLPSIITVMEGWMFFFPEKVCDTVISHLVQPGCQVFDPPDVVESDRELVEDILQDILSFDVVRNPPPYIAK